MKYISLLLLLLALLSSGCSAWRSTTKYAKESWESTKDYIDPPPEIDTDSYQFESPNQEKLAKLFTPVDGPLTSLSRFIDDQDTLPDFDWLDLLLSRFPWVHRVIVTDEEGTIIVMQPEIPVKKIDKPLVFEGVWRDIGLLTVVDYSDLGPELYIGRPYFEDVAFPRADRRRVRPQDVAQSQPETGRADHHSSRRRRLVARGECGQGGASGRPVGRNPQGRRPGPGPGG